mmetsp:Transcript_20189/g.48513  ORF Transcript_20189/g.48513 Transcript_20189/m.48513 type:complete len:100 (+) Transcript_20189:631-930(+)
MSNLIGRTVGDRVGYAVRGESRRSPYTSVLVVTDGVLLNMIRDDPELGGFDAAILDKFHGARRRQRYGACVVGGGSDELSTGPQDRRHERDAFGRCIRR